MFTTAPISSILIIYAKPQNIAINFYDKASLLKYQESILNNNERFSKPLKNKENLNCREGLMGN